MGAISSGGGRRPGGLQGRRRLHHHQPLGQEGLHAVDGGRHWQGDALRVYWYLKYNF